MGRVGERVRPRLDDDGAANPLAEFVEGVAQAMVEDHPYAALAGSPEEGQGQAFRLEKGEFRGRSGAVAEIENLLLEEEDRLIQLRISHSWQGRGFYAGQTPTG